MKFSTGDFIQLSIFLISLSVFAQKPVPLYLRLFPLYLFLLMIEDLVIEYTSPLGIHNNIIPNIGGIAEFAFYFFVIRSVIVNTNVKKRIYYVTLAFAVFAVIILLIHGNELFNPINFTVGTVITVVFCIYYFLLILLFSSFSVIPFLKSSIKCLDITQLQENISFCFLNNFRFQRTRSRGCNIYVRGCTS